MTPEVHFMGEVTGGVGFGPGVSCKFTIEFGKNWDLLSGEYLGQTQYGYAEKEEMVSWNHPIDLHMSTSSMQGWPRIRFQVWELDEYGRTNLSGYGFIHLPTNAGSYEICVPCWRPTGSLPEEVREAATYEECLADEEQNVTHHLSLHSSSLLVTFRALESTIPN